MPRQTVCRIAISLLVTGALAGCGSWGKLGARATPQPDYYNNANIPGNIETDPDNTIWSIFRTKTADNKVAVNRFLWSASLEVLNFLPIQTVDPYTGVIVTGYGTPPGGGRAYRATVLIDDPALDARSLSVALQTRGGRPVSKATVRAVEDAILSRARELRIADNKL